MSPDAAAVLRRIDDLLDRVLNAALDTSALTEAYQGTITLVGALYGADAPQAKALSQALKSGTAAPLGYHATAVAQVFALHIRPAVIGALRAMKGDVEAGLVGNLQRRGAGEVLADLLSLAKDALAGGSADGNKSVAAVLVAAAYEDTIRRMGTALANVSDRPDLSKVIGALKNAKVLEGPPLVTALSYLKLRNDALHADWVKIDRAVVGSCISFVEGLILQHLS